jgi:ectoine hydroxylase-related dioxygenase (phytanoyl-CoA dioxygenase family)
MKIVATFERVKTVIMRNVLNDQNLEKKFQEDGYVIIPFLSDEEVKFLRDKFFELLPKSGGNITASDTGFDMPEITYDFTFIDKNIEFKREVYDIISKKFGPNMDKWLNNYQPIIANYIRKKSDQGEVPLHQNWSFADEKKCCTVSIWCPMVDATIQNGTLQVVPGSHKRFGEVRGPMVPWELENIRKEIIDNYLVPIEIPAGHAVILDDSIIHYSAINTTNDLRLAIQLICIPKEMPSWHYHKGPNSGENVDILEVDKDFYMEFNPWKFPENVKKVHEFKYSNQYITEAEFKQRLQGPRYDEPLKPTGLIQKIKELIFSTN